AFIIPYMFIYEPQLLMIDATILQILWIIFTAITGMIAIGAGLIGFWYMKLNWIVRIISVLTGLLLIYPEKYSDFAGLGMFIVLVAVQLVFSKNKGSNQKTSVEA
ncbi:MAG TPA: TRAP transporter permease, partial [Bacillus sp. (in: firmicutes)]|nr:TRAP transporter permease [Bacillus sp. (in: firmicutes)]